MIIREIYAESEEEESKEEIKVSKEQKSSFATRGFK